MSGQLWIYCRRLLLWLLLRQLLVNHHRKQNCLLCSLELYIFFDTIFRAMVFTHNLLICYSIQGFWGLCALNLKPHRDRSFLTHIQRKETSGCSRSSSSSSRRRFSFVVLPSGRMHSHRIDSSGRHSYNYRQAVSPPQTEYNII